MEPKSESQSQHEELKKSVINKAKNKTIDLFHPASKLDLNNYDITENIMNIGEFTIIFLKHVQSIMVNMFSELFIKLLSRSNKECLHEFDKEKAVLVVLC